MDKSLIEKIDGDLSDEEFEYLLSDLNCRIMELETPSTVQGMTVVRNGGYLVILNKHLDALKKRQVLKHELLHIFNTDFSKGKTLEEKEGAD